jgi:hypothetical protein
MRKQSLTIILFLSILAGYGICAVPAQTHSQAIPAGLTSQELPVYKLVMQLNEVSEVQVNERTEPAYSILRAINDADGPAYTQLRRIIGRSTVRAALNPTAKAVFAGLLSDKSDSFSLAGNLWLAALRSANPDYKLKARQKLVEFIQPAHIPVLISILKIPGPNVQAYEILQEVTGQSFDPREKTWKDWWTRKHGKVDLTGHMLKVVSTQLSQTVIRPADLGSFWYVPEQIKNASLPYAKRSSSEQLVVTHWNEWAGNDVRRFVDDWMRAKPLFDKIVHQPDPRVNNYLQNLISDPSFSDYASVILAWRGSKSSLSAIQHAFPRHPTPSLALARGSLGDRDALRDLIQMTRNNPNPSSFGIMDQNARSYVSWLRLIGIVPAEQALELLTHHNFGFESAATRREKKKAIKQAEKWLKDNEGELLFNSKGGFFYLPVKNSYNSRHGG